MTPFDEHSELVQEVLSLVEGGVLNQSPPKDHSWHVVRDLDEAKRMAWEVPIGDEEFLWTDIRQREMSLVRGVAYSRPGFSSIKDSLSTSLIGMTKRLESQLPQQFLPLVDDIAGDLFGCAFNRAVNGPNGFYEQIFAAYKAGGWPCAWIGNYPTGTLVVYFSR